MKKIISFGLALLALFPALSYAHVKWFAEPVMDMRPYEITDKFVINWILITIAIVLVGLFLEKKTKTPVWLETKIPKWKDKILSISSIGFGLAFILFSAYGYVFAPNLEASGRMGLLLLGLQALIGLMFLLGIYARAGAVLLIGLFALATFKYGISNTVDATEILGIALFMLIAGRPKWRIIESLKIKEWFSKWSDYAVPILRVGTGINLMVLGFTEKILTPSLTQNFLANYHWNFMEVLGFASFTNYWFAFSAGMTEFIFGLMLLLGLVTRITTIALAVFLATTLYLLGPVELIGHLPHFAIAIVLLVIGSGSNLKLTK